jgi:hypothetical protein
LGCREFRAMKNVQNYNIQYSRLCMYYVLATESKSNILSAPMKTHNLSTLY